MTIRRLAILLVLAVCVVIVPRPLQAQVCTQEIEPNDQPPQATPLAGAGCISAEIGDNDQDLYAWSVTDADAQRSWEFALQGTPTGLTGMQVLRVEFADNGVDVLASTKLFEMSTVNGESVQSGPLLFSPGVYYLGLSAADGRGAYQLDLQPGAALPAMSDAGSSAETPSPLSAGAGETTLQASGDLQGQDDYFSWTLSESDASQRWRITAQLPLGENGYIYLFNAAGNQLTYQEVDERGLANMPSLGLSPGTYLLRLSSGRDYSTAYLVAIQPDGERSPTYEEEPNGDASLAWPLDPTQMMEGAFPTGHYDIDFFKFSVDAEFAARQWQLTTSPSIEADFELCLLDSATTQLQCREGVAPLLPDLALTPGDYYVTFRNRDRTAADYTIQFEEIGDIAQERELEPNDGIAQASLLGAENAVRGRFSGSEDDFYRFSVSGEPQLWRVQVSGSGINTLAFLEIDGREPSRVDVSDSTRARLDDLYLLPGDHFLRVRGVDGEYTVRVIPIGPPAAVVAMPSLPLDGVNAVNITSGQTSNATTTDQAANAETTTGITEREPNDAVDRAERLPFDTPRSGRLSSQSDRDVYRFYLAGNEHVRLIVVQPADGRLQVDLDNLFFNALRQDGSPIIYESVMGPGDHIVNIDASQPSDDIYYLLLQRLSPIDFPFDLEPANNEFKDAPLLPPTLTVSGAVNNSEDYRDWVRLPALERASVITVTITPTMALDVRSDNDTFYAQTQDADAGVYSFALPAQDLVGIGVSGDGAYTMSVAFADGPRGQPAPKPLPVTLSLTAATGAISAFWEQGQRIDLTLTLTNTGSSELNLALAAVTTDFAWQPSPWPSGEGEIRLEAGETRSIPLPLKILPNVSDALAARVAVRVTDGTGAFATTTLDLPAACAVLPVNPDSGWTTAGALRGGLNVAWSGFGSAPVSSDSSNNSDAAKTLFDEISTPAYGWRGQQGERVTVDLAGEEPAPVAGVILNSFGRSAPEEQLRHFEVLLSQDGVTFELAYAGELTENTVDQSFAFSQPIPARFAQLHMVDNWRGEGEIGLGEFKVIARKEYRPPTTFNLLDPAHGGHVVSGAPLLSNLQEIVTTADEQPGAYADDPPQPAEWVVGFHHNRAAQITALHWRNWDNGTPERRFTNVAVEVSTESPVGPWQPVTTWTLDPALVTTQTLTLNAPVWARFVRFVAQPPGAERVYEYPDTLAIDEQPIDASYRSILAEWGGYRPQAIYEEIQSIHPLASRVNEVEPNDERKQAQLLAAGQPVLGTVVIDGDQDWFKLEVPADANTLSVTLSGEPLVSVDYQLLDSSGQALTHTAEITAGVLKLNAAVTPGVYFLGVLDPRRSIVFTWDTSGSVGPYLPQIYQSMATFTQGIDPQFQEVQLIPFGDPGPLLLEDFSGDPLQVQQAFNDYPRAESSSSAERNLLAASDSLAPRKGLRGIVLMTDAESSSYEETDALWQSLAAVRPRIFSFEISSGGNPDSQDLMQDWAAVNHGHYDNLSTTGEFEQGFARATCLLRRPTPYGVTVTYSSEALPPPTPEPTPTPLATPTPAAPGALHVVGQLTAAGEPARVVGGGVVELILDASGSMLQQIDGKTKIAIARDVLTNLTSNVLPAGAQIALRVFGHKEAGSCRTDLEIPLQPLDVTAVNQIIAGINAMNLAKTPIADSLRLVAEDLANTTGQKVVILVTDGEETCDGDPEQEIRALREQGIDVRINIVGFDVDDAGLKTTFQRWAAEGGGNYFNASNAAELDSAVTNALSAPFRLLDANGTEIAVGVVNGDPIPAPAGTYTVEVLTTPIRQLPVTVNSGETVTVEMEP